MQQQVLDILHVNMTNAPNELPKSDSLFDEVYCSNSVLLHVLIPETNAPPNI